MDRKQSKLIQRHAWWGGSSWVHTVRSGAAMGVILLTSQLAAAKPNTQKAAREVTAEVPSPAPRRTETDEPSFLGAGIGLFVEDSERTQQSLIGGQEAQEQEPQELVSASVFNVQVWYLRPILISGLRWGGGAAWFSRYSLQEPDAEDDAEPYAAGHMFQLGLQAEYELAQVAGKLGVVFGLRGGAALLFPGQDLQAELDGMERLGLDVWGGPQPGAYVAPLLGVRFPLSARVNLRADISAQFAKLWLYSADGEAEGITSERSAALTTTRTQLLVGLDFTL